MARAPEPDADDMLWTVAMARIVFGPAMNIQAPPNLSPGLIGDLIAAGINDWGGVSPVTPDHVNPEAPWPAIERLRAETAAAGKCLTERLAIYPEYVARARRAGSIRLCRRAVLRAADADGFARGEEWAPGLRAASTRDHDRRIRRLPGRPSRRRALDRIVQRASAGHRLGRGRHRRAVPGARRRIRRRLRRGRRFAPDRQRRHRRLCRQPQHQLHQRLQLRLPVLRLLQGQARRQPARSGLRPRSRRNRAPRARGLGSRRHRSLHAGRHPSALHRRRPIFRSSTPPSAP